MVYVSLLGNQLALFTKMVSTFLLAIKCRTFRHLLQMAERDINEVEFRLIHSRVLRASISYGICYLFLMTSGIITS